MDLHRLPDWSEWKELSLHFSHHMSFYCSLFSISHSGFIASAIESKQCCSPCLWAQENHPHDATQNKICLSITVDGGYSSRASRWGSAPNKWSYWLRGLRWHHTAHHIPHIVNPSFTIAFVGATANPRQDVGGSIGGFDGPAALNIKQPTGSTFPQGAEADAFVINTITADLPPQSSHQAPPLPHKPIKIPYVTSHP
jgi:hypothetical protein